MAKLCVVATGLVALAPPTASDPTARILLRRVAEKTNVNEVEILPHKAVVRFRTGSGGAGIHDIELENGVAVNFTPIGAGGLRIERPNLFLPLGDNLKERLPVKADFRDGGADPSILAGRVTLDGGTVNPIELDDIFDLRQVRRKISAQLRGTAILGGKQQNREPSLAANGLLYELELTKGVIPSISIGSAEARELFLAPASELGFLAAEGSNEVYVVWIVNTARLDDGTDAPKNVAGKAERMTRVGHSQEKKVAGGVPLGFDPDFHLLYDFVDFGKRQRARLVPLIFDPTTGPGDPPGRCMLGFTA